MTTSSSRDLVVLCTRGTDHELSSVALTIACGDITSGLKVYLFLTSSSVDLVRKRGVDMTHVPPLDPLKQLLDDFIARGAAAGVATLELEVFAANERALRLYRGRGFAIAQPLHGHDRPAEAPPLEGPVPAVRPVALDKANAQLDDAERRIADLPLQVSAAPLASAALAAPGSLHAWQLGHAQLVFAERPGEPVMVQSLVDHDPEQPGAEALVRALVAAFAGRAIRVPALQRPDLGGDALQRAGFTPQPLHQWLMKRPARLVG